MDLFVPRSILPAAYSNISSLFVSLLVVNILAWMRRSRFPVAFVILPDELTGINKAQTTSATSCNNAHLKHETDFNRNGWSRKHEIAFSLDRMLQIEWKVSSPKELHAYGSYAVRNSLYVWRVYYIVLWNFVWRVAIFATQMDIGSTRVNLKKKWNYLSIVKIVEIIDKNIKV